MPYTKSNVLYCSTHTHTHTHTHGLLHQWLFMSSWCSPHASPDSPQSFCHSAVFSPLSAISRNKIANWDLAWPLAVALTSAGSRAFNPAPRLNIRGGERELTFFRLRFFLILYVLLLSSDLQSRRLPRRSHFGLVSWSGFVPSAFWPPHSSPL